MAKQSGTADGEGRSSAQTWPLLAFQHADGRSCRANHLARARDVAAGADKRWSKSDDGAALKIALLGRVNRQLKIKRAFHRKPADATCKIKRAFCWSPSAVANDIRFEEKAVREQMYVMKRRPFPAEFTDVITVSATMSTSFLQQVMKMAPSKPARTFPGALKAIDRKRLVLAKP